MCTEDGIRRRPRPPGRGRRWSVCRSSAAVSQTPPYSAAWRGNSQTVPTCPGTAISQTTHVVQKIRNGPGTSALYIHSLTIFYTTTFWLFWSGLFCTRLLSFSTVWCASHKSIDRYCNWLPWLELYLIIKFAHKLEVTFCALLVYDTVPLLRHQNTQGQGQVMLQQWVL